MKITKYEQSCIDVEQDGVRLLIDPGVVTNSVPHYDNISGVVVTHVHPDHLDIEKLKAIVTSNPEVKIYTVQAVADEIKGAVPVEVVTGGNTASVGPFQLEFVGGQHALIHETIPLTDNVGVLVNGRLYSPGDSFSIPHTPVEILGAPVTAPWMRLAEAMDFITAIKPQHVFPIHDALLSDFGMQVNSGRLESASIAVGAKYTELKPGDSLSV